MTVGEFRDSQMRRVFSIGRNYGFAGLLLGAFMTIQGLFKMSPGRINYLGKKRMEGRFHDAQRI